jgi:predicted ATPase/serine phosphatase RsbU (regulator of sigma subunit)/tRNA A-37 threonylcarbamoyl transferase component Bud32
MIKIKNYQIHTQIYQSANSVIYRGMRKKDNQPVILKVLKEDYPTPEELTRYRQEYEIMRLLTNVESVVKAYDLEKYQNTLVMILEDFGGESLKVIFEKLNGSKTEESSLSLSKRGKLSISNFLSLAIQMTDSLAQIHRQNIIHKDINPSNIILNPSTGVLKMIDFGIATQFKIQHLRLTNPEVLEGTLAYMSPEQTGRMNRALDYRTDFYSLGVTFYELLTGKVPFESDDAMELVHCHIAKTPVPACEVNPDVPPIISDIVMKLMAKNAEDRYQSTFGVKFDLEKCLENLISLKKLEGLLFELAQNDFSGYFKISPKLYGRESEINTLLQAFERISMGTTEMMLVAGYSGVGKSALVREVHKPMTAKQGYFAAGKFDQYQRNIPYFAISQAFNSFCDYLLTENTAKLQQWCDKILTAVGNNGQVLLDVIPRLEVVIGPQPAVIQVGALDAQNRFNLVFQKFCRAICQPSHPLVLFIDDLQWADLASLTLLKLLLTDADSGYLLLLGAYRDNEVNAAHPLMTTIEEVKNQAVVNTLFLQNLSSQDVNALIADALRCEPVQTTTLTELVYDKTQGNAFFTSKFLETLYEQELLKFEWSTHQWHWDMAQIAAQALSDNVVDLLARKIAKLSPQTQTVLKLAAAIGNQFDLHTLSVIAQDSPKDTLALLWHALAEDLLLPLDDNYKNLEQSVTHPATIQFKFQHDRVHQASYSLIATPEQPVLHRQIGQLLLANTPEDQLENHIFDIVNHFNQALPVISGKADKFQVAELNLQAGQKAIAALAYQPALVYLQTALGLLENDTWQKHHDFCLQLYTQAAKAAFLNTEFELMDKWGQVVLQHAKTRLDRLKIYDLQIDAYSVLDKLDEALSKGLSVLKEWGISFSEEPTDSDIQKALAKTQALLNNRPIETLYKMPQPTAPDKQIIMRISSTLTYVAYVKAPKIFPLVTCETVNFSIKYGNSAASALGYIQYGVILCLIGEDIESGFQFGKLGLRLIEQFPDSKSRNFAAFEPALRHWKEHLKNSLKPSLEGYQSGLEIGDSIGSGANISFYCMYLYLVGQKLTVVEQEIAVYNHSLIQLKQDVCLAWTEITQQAVLNLIEPTSENSLPYRLSGKAFNEAERSPLDDLGFVVMYVNKLILCYLFQVYLEALENSSRVEPYLEFIGEVFQHLFCFYTSLAKLAVYSDSPPQERATILDKVAANQKKMQHWAHHAPMNFLHKFYLVEAERCRVLGQDGEAREYYDKAIEGARDNEYLNEEALAYELAGQFYARKGLPKLAQVYLRDAHYAYQRWGALAKVKDLEERYPFLAPSRVSAQSTVITTNDRTLMTSIYPTQQTPATFLDLKSVVKASQTVSGEIVLNRLLKKMMQIVIENAGAENGFLLLPQGNNWFIEAQGQVDSEAVKVLQSISLENQPIAQTIIHYVERTQENVVLHDASQEGQFTRDPHIVEQKSKSLLCTPLINQGKITGILYLENNLTTGAFTPNRLEVLKVLSSQLAISIENALLYQTLEQKVEERTAQLAEANEEITALNEQLQSENLRMSAELNVSRQLQQMLLPKEEELKAIEGLDIAGFMEPADEVGGDYYDVLQHNGRILFGIGDVTGHGLKSGALAIMVQSSIRTLLALNETDPVKFFSALNEMVFHNVQRMNLDKNLTLVLVDYKENQLYLSGQHEEMIIIRNGELELIDTMDLGFPVGLDEEIADFVNQVTVPLNAGDVVVLYTDGITEAENLDGQMYGQERLCEIIQQNWQQTAQEIIEVVIAAVRQFIGEQKVFDDITLLVLKQK